MLGRKLYCPSCRKDVDARESHRSKGSKDYDNVSWECSRCGMHLDVTMEKKKGWW